MAFRRRSFKKRRSFGRKTRSKKLRSYGASRGGIRL